MSSFSEVNLIFKCRQYGDNAMFSDWSSDSDSDSDSKRKKEKGHNVISRPELLDSDSDADPDKAFHHLHNVHPVPIANSPTPSTVDPKELRNDYGQLKPLSSADVRVIFSIRVFE